MLYLLLLCNTQSFHILQNHQFCYTVHQRQWRLLYLRGAGCSLVMPWLSCTRKTKKKATTYWWQFFPKAAYKSLPHCFSNSDLDLDYSIRVFRIQLQIILGGAKPPIITFTGAAAPLLRCPCRTCLHVSSDICN